MVLAFIEHGTVELHESEETAAAAWPGLDVAAGVVSFYRDDGIYLEPIFTVPNRDVRLLGFSMWKRSGTYHLAPQPNAEEDPLWLALLEHPDLKPSLGFSTTDQLKRYLVSKGVVVEKPASV